MKALLIADNKTAIDNISQILESAGYDVIIYKWLIKALDNIEEICPHLIIVNAKDYPRHWKTLTQFASTSFGSYKPAVIVYAEGGLDEEEAQKAKALGVRGVFESVDVKGLSALRSILAGKDDIYSGKLNEKQENEEKVISVDSLLNNESTAVEEVVSEDVELTEDESVVSEEEEFTEDESVVSEEEGFTEEDTVVSEEEALTKDEAEISEEPDLTENESLLSEEPVLTETENQDSLSSEDDFSVFEEAAHEAPKYCSFAFTNPVSGVLVTGYATNFDGKSFEFNADIDEFVKNLDSGVQIPWGSIKIDQEFASVCATVKSNQDILVLELN